MDRFSAMSAFVRCVERGSFSAVARERETTQPTISKLIAGLERHLGSALFARATRRLTLTPEGQRFYEQCKQILELLEGAESTVRSEREALSGVLRVAAPVGFGRMTVVPHLPTFMTRHPEIRIDLQLNDRFVDLVEEGIDVAFRVGALKDSNLVARRIGTTHRVAVASPAYLKAHKTPRHPKELVDHSCVIYTGLAAPYRWTFTRRGESQSVPVKGAFQTNSSEAVREAALAGLGVALSPVWLFGADLATKRVVRLLSDYDTDSMPIHAVYPTNRRHSAKVRVFAEYFAAEFNADPLVSGFERKKSR